MHFFKVLYQLNHDHHNHYLKETASTRPKTERVSCVNQDPIKASYGSGN